MWSRVVEVLLEGEERPLLWRNLCSSERRDVEKAGGLSLLL
ncbi:MAG: hypothetical protein N3E36_06785 [Sulfolobales archaeon]|nr:hypothetical protein [Sulfolobales archaeon]